MSREPMKSRVIRVSEDLWRQAQAKADDRGEVLSEVIRDFLRRYVRRSR